jgi:hypothetical protein
MLACPLVSLLVQIPQVVTYVLPPGLVHLAVLSHFRAELVHPGLAAILTSRLRVAQRVQARFPFLPAALLRRAVAVRGQSPSQPVRAALAVHWLLRPVRALLALVALSA